MVSVLFSQTKDSCHAGVYATKEDFLKNHLSYKINKDVNGNKFEFSIPADLTLTIKIVMQGSVVRFKPGSVYGYSECGRIFRYYSGPELNVQEDYYKIEEAKGIVIYSSAFISGNEIFYSLDLTSPIHRLTMKNIENDFSNYPEFLSSIKKMRDDPDDGIAKRDDKGSFIINQIYRATVGPYK